MQEYFDAICQALTSQKLFLDIIRQGILDLPEMIAKHEDAVALIQEVRCTRFQACRKVKLISSIKKICSLM